MIDTHTHLFDSRFDSDVNDTILRAAQVGVTHFVLPAIDSQSHEALLTLARKCPNCLPTMGLHPTSVNENSDFKLELDTVHNYLFNTDVPFVAVGEIGLDLYWSKDFVEQQIVALQMQTQWAIRKNLPIILHVRDAWNEIFDALAPFKGTIRGVFHSFLGTYDDYLKTQQFGDFYVGIGGPLTYKKSTLSDVVRQIPLQRMLLETDAPYLPPVPHRGTRNEPAYVTLVADKIAELLEITPSLVDEVTTQNARQLFKI